jgi:hypothetical protein
MLTRNRVAAAGTVLVLALASLWLLAVPQMISRSTYAVCAALVLALGGVVLVTYRNGQASGSMGQLLHETDVASTTPVGTSGATTTSATPKY